MNVYGCLPACVVISFASRLNHAPRFFDVPIYQVKHGTNDFTSRFKSWKNDARSRWVNVPLSFTNHCQPVTLDSEALNKLPPKRLRDEHIQQKAVEHTALMRLGYIRGDMVPVPGPDPEAKARIVLTDQFGKVKLLML